jgi:hypothetical protein
MGRVHGADATRPSGAGSTRQPALARHGTATRDGADTDLELTQDGLVGREANVGGQHELGAGARGPATDLRDHGHRHPAQPHEVVHVRVQARRPGRFPATPALSARKPQWAMK